jgi:hypothetical protein
LARLVVGMLPKVISVAASRCQCCASMSVKTDLPAVLETLALTELAVAIKVVLSKLRLLERKKLLSKTGSQSPKWLVMKTIVPSAIQAACVVAKTSELLKVITTEVFEQSTLIIEAICSRITVGYFIVWLILTLAEVVMLEP